MGRCVGKNVHMPYSGCMGCMGLDLGWNSCSAIWGLCNIGQIPGPVHPVCSVSALHTLHSLQVRWSCDSDSGLLLPKEQGWAALSNSPSHHKLLMAGPEKERFPHKLSQDRLWVPTSLQWWFLAGCVLCKLIFCIFNYSLKMCIFEELQNSFLSATDVSTTANMCLIFQITKGVEAFYLCVESGFPLDAIPG